MRAPEVTALRNRGRFWLVLTVDLISVIIMLAYLIVPLQTAVVNKLAGGAYLLLTFGLGCILHADKVAWIENPCTKCPDVCDCDCAYECSTKARFSKAVKFAWLTGRLDKLARFDTA